MIPLSNDNNRSDDYTVVTAYGAEALINRVNLAIKNGYKLAGNLFIVTNNGEQQLCQPMLKNNNVGMVQMVGAIKT